MEEYQALRQILMGIGDTNSVLIIDFINQHETKLKELWIKYEADTGDVISFEEFAAFIYHNAQDLVFDPIMN